MDNQAKIAVFIDIDNCAMTLEQYLNAMSQIKQLGKIIYGRAYGVNERKQPQILTDLVSHGFDIYRPMIEKKPKSRVFDCRIAIDVVEYVITREKILDAVAILCCSNNPLPLFSKVSSYGVQIIALPSVQGQSNSYITHLIKLDNMFTKPPQPQRRKPKPQTANVVKEVTVVTETVITDDEQVDNELAAVSNSVSELVSEAAKQENSFQIDDTQTTLTAANLQTSKADNEEPSKQVVNSSLSEQTATIKQEDTQISQQLTEQPSNCSPLNEQKQVSDTIIENVKSQIINSDLDQELINQIKKLLIQQT